MCNVTVSKNNTQVKKKSPDNKQINDCIFIKMEYYTAIKINTVLFQHLC